MSRVFYLPSFLKQIEKLRGHEAAEVEEVLVKFQHFAQTGEKSEGLGFKKLGDACFEIRVNIRMRIAMKKMEDAYYLAILGNHDEIEKFLRKQ